MAWLEITFRDPPEPDPWGEAIGTIIGLIVFVVAVLAGLGVFA